MTFQTLLTFALACLFLFGLLKILNRLQQILLELHKVRQDIYERSEEE